MSGSNRAANGIQFPWPPNIGSEEMVSINRLTKMIMEIAKKELTIKHIKGPLGVRGRNSDNALIKKVLAWAPSLPLKKRASDNISLDRGAS